MVAGELNSNVKGGNESRGQSVLPTLAERNEMDHSVIVRQVPNSPLR